MLITGEKCCYNMALLMYLSNCKVLSGIRSLSFAVINFNSFLHVFIECLMALLVCSACHVLLVSDSSVVILFSDEVLKCGICAYTCISTACMKSHLKIHTQDKPFSCRHCQYTCRQQGKLCRLQFILENIFFTIFNRV